MRPLLAGHGRIDHRAPVSGAFGDDGFRHCGHPPKLAHGHHPLRDHRTRDFDGVRVAEPRNGEMAAEKAFFRRRDQPSEGGIGRLRVDGVAGMDAPALCIEDGK